MSQDFCKIYVECRSKKIIEDVLKSKIGLDKKGHYFIGKGVDLDIRNNDFADCKRYSYSWDGFVYSSYYLEVEPLGGFSRGRYIQTVNNILSALREEKCLVVAAADFEDELTAPEW